MGSEVMDSEVLRAIKDLEGKSFEIPSYQRGYRWGKREVEALLQDILDFSQKQSSQKQSSSFYCLQPVVVKKDKEKYRIIDGQQRLTTIFLIIKFLQNKDYFEITYQSRKESVKFLQNIENEKEHKNIDFYHFKKAYKNIKEFFNNKDQDKDQVEFYKILLEDCKILWYEISDNENDVFMRLNIGKIPLLEAENIKALFLSKNDELESDDLKERAEFWYESEKGARDNRDFRYCVLSHVDEKDIEDKKIKDDILRIEAYLKALVPYSTKKHYPTKKHYLFDYFYKHYKNGTLNKEWDRLKVAINTLSSFASRGTSEKIDREIFHYLGFLILSGEKIHSLYKQWEAVKNKENFKNALFEKVKKRVSGINIDELNYTENKKGIKNILLLFNLEYLIADASSNEYFQFNRFVLEQWSLEHIYAQNSKSIKEAIKNKNNESIKEWLKEVLQYIDDPSLQNEIEKSIENENFEDELFGKIDENFTINESLHSIQNLTLLDKESNSKIGNQIFSQKRKAIQKLGEEDKLIPIATKKVFEKVFSKDKSCPDVFSETDQEAYLNAIKEKLQAYLKDNK